MKLVYSFTVDIDGEDVKILIKRPNHIEVEDAEFVYSQKFNQLLSAGFLSRSMMNKKYGDIGGVYSEKMLKELSIAVEKLADCERTIQFFESAEDLSNEHREELAEAKEVYTNIQFNIANMDNDLESMYSNSADTKAEAHMIKWYVLFLSFFEETIGEETEVFPIFDGNTFAEKIESFSEFLSDVDDNDEEGLSKKKKIASASLEKLSQIINLWWSGYGETEEALEKNFKKFFIDNQPQPPVEEEPEKEEKKPATKKAAKKKDE